MSNADNTMNEVQELVWGLLDEQAAENDIRRLEALLLASAEARRVYIMCIQLHVDLCILLGGKRFPLPRAIPPVRQPGLPPLGSPPGAADSTALNGHGSG